MAAKEAKAEKTAKAARAIEKAAGAAEEAAEAGAGAPTKSERKKAPAARGAGQKHALKAAPASVELAGAPAMSEPAIASREGWIHTWLESAMREIGNAQSKLDYQLLLSEKGHFGGHKEASEDMLAETALAEAREAFGQADERCDWALGSAMFASLGDPTPVSRKQRERGPRAAGEITLSWLLDFATRLPESIWERESWMAGRLAAWLRAEAPAAQPTMVSEIAKALASERSPRIFAALDEAIGPFSVADARWLGRKNDRDLLRDMIMRNLEPEAAREIERREPGLFKGQGWAAFANAMLDAGRRETLDAMGLDGRPLGKAWFAGLGIQEREAAWAGPEVTAAGSFERSADGRREFGQERKTTFWRAVASRALGSAASASYVGLMSRQIKSLGAAMAADDELARQIGDAAIVALAGELGESERLSVAAQATWDAVPAAHKARPGAWLSAQAMYAARECANDARNINSHYEKDAREKLARIGSYCQKRLDFLAGVPMVDGGGPAPVMAILETLKAFSPNAMRSGAASAADLVAGIAIGAIKKMLDAWGMEKPEPREAEEIGSELVAWTQIRAALNPSDSVAGDLADLASKLGACGFEPRSWAKERLKLSETGQMVLSAVEAGQVRRVASDAQAAKRKGAKKATRASSPEAASMGEEAAEAHRKPLRV
jgi:hypothetical protein